MCDDENILLTPKQMAKADALAIKGGVPSIDLMENAGQVVAEQILASYQKCNVLVICGPGNNGGDGFVVARLLKQQGWQVELALFGNKSTLKGDAKINADRYEAEIKILHPNLINNADLIVDALFGTGLDRNIEGDLAHFIDLVNKSGLPVVAIDIASGIDGETGQVRGIAIIAKQTVSFFKPKLGHYLLPGREYCNQLHIADIGIVESVLQKIEVSTWLNSPNLWTLPKRNPLNHKYDAGHCIVISGDELHTGAARLAARSALRIGAGLVTLAGEKSALLVHANHLSSIMLIEAKTANELSNILLDKRFNSIVIGPALGVGSRTQKLVLAALNSSASMVIDADGMSSFSKNPQILFDAIKAKSYGEVVLTPHMGEFAKLFDINDISKVKKARLAAKISGATIVLKGADTIIATPNGKVAINNNAPPYLATAGSGDVLSGIIGGLLAQGLSAKKAAMAGVYLHGEAGSAFGGQGLIADDLPSLLPFVLRQDNN